MDFEVNRQDFRETRTVPTAPVDLKDGQIRLTVERFAFTTNNITYAVAGDMLDYWGFFPAEAPWGRLPAMGLSSVVESAHPEIAVGGRYFGFTSMSAEVVLDVRPQTNGFRHVGAHRANHAAVYTDFADVSTDPMFHDDHLDEYLLLRGLFTTSFLVDDYLADNDFHGAAQTLVTSASSKTSISLAACLAQRGHRAVGLTSPRNVEFVESLGFYDEVVTYDQVHQLDAAVPSVLVDMAGSAPVRAAAHGHFAETLKFSSTVGATHWEADPGGAEPLPGPTPEFFFAPSQIAKRNEDWGPEEVQKRLAAAFGKFVGDSARWMNVSHHQGAKGITQVHSDLLEGQAAPDQGFIVSL